MRRTIFLHGLALLGVLLATQACVNLLEPRESIIQYYVLGGGQELEILNPPSDATGLSIGMRKLRLAPYLDTPTVVTRTGPHEIRFSEVHRWGEDLQRAINRTVAGYLSTLPGIQNVDVVPWPQQATYDYVVQIHVLRFEGEAPRRAFTAEGQEAAASAIGTVRAVATWDIIDPDTGTVLARGTTDHREEDWTVGNYPQLVNKLDASLAVLAEDLAVRLVDLEQASFRR